MTWRINYEKERIEFKVKMEDSTNPNGTSRLVNLLIGFSDHGKIPGSDFCLYRRDNLNSNNVSLVSIFLIIN